VVLVADTFARVLGAIALGVGCVGTIIAVLTYLRDRPRLKVNWSFRLHRDEDDQPLAHVVVRVVNDGRQAIAVSDVGIRNFPSLPRSKRGVRVRFRLARLLWYAARPFRRWRPLLFNRWVERLTSLEGEFGSGMAADKPLEEPRVLRPGEALDVQFAAKRLGGLEPGEGRWYAVATDALGREVSEEMDEETVSMLRETIDALADQR